MPSARTAASTSGPEPYNDRANWKVVQEGHNAGTPEHEWFDRAFGDYCDPMVWSSYATELYQALRARAEADGWLSKLRYMLYEADVQPTHAERFCDLHGVLLQSVNKNEVSSNPAFRPFEKSKKGGGS